MAKINPGAIILLIFMMVVLCGTADAGGPFGPPQPLTKDSGGIRTAVGYWYHEDKFSNDTDHVIKQNQVYSEVAYGAGKTWEVYGRIGVSSIEIDDALSSTRPS
ncbi:MAG TPA: hypothetical protein P5244_08880, partial [Syntrophales bacterium]|nr:hypothetical protein [Syntrophales bacterium]